MFSLRRRSVIAIALAAVAVAAGLIGATAASAAAPANVTGLTATPLSSTSIRLNWTNPTTADLAGVHICRGFGTTAPTMPCSGVNVTKPTATYTDTFQLIPNTKYTYAVFSYNTAAVTATGATVTVTTPAAPAPGNVTGLTATPLASGSVTLNWTNPTNADFAGVLICRNIGTTAPTYPPCGGVKVAKPGTTYTDSNALVAGTHYTYTVTAYNTAGSTASGTSVGVTTAAAAAGGNVTGLTATPLSGTSVRLNWTNPTNADFAGVRICRNFGATAPTYPCGGVNVAKPGATYTDVTSLTPSTQYTYSVIAFTSSGATSSGTSVTVTTPAAAGPNNVTALTATPQSATSVQLNWTNPTNADFAGVRICRNFGTTAPTYPCGGVNVPAGTTTYTDSFQLIPGTQYTYSVIAFNSAGTTASGTAVTVTTPSS